VRIPPHRARGVEIVDAADPPATAADMGQSKHPPGKTDRGQQAEDVGGWRAPVLFTVGGLVAYAAAMVGFGFWVRSRLSWNDAGNFGDMFGAFSAFASGLSLFGVVVAIVLQYRQLKMQRHDLELHREELRLQREELAGSRRELAKQAYISALAARVSALASLKESGEMASELYATNRTLKEYVDAMSAQVPR